MANVLQKVELFADFESKAIYIGDVFTDPDGDPLTITVQSSEVVGLSIDGDSLRITSSFTPTGSIVVTLTASDGDLSVSSSFDLDIKANIPLVLLNVPHQGSWRDAILQGSGVVFDMKGRVLYRFAKGVSEHEILSQIRNAGGRAMIRMGHHSWMATIQ